MLSFEILQRIHKATEIAESGELDHLAVGEYDLFDGIHVNVMNIQTSTERTFEAHHKYIDIHYPISDDEQIEIADEEKMDVLIDYDEKNDCILGNAKGKRYKIMKNHVFIVFPGEAHAPGLCDDGIREMKKAVIKVSAD